MYALDVEVIDTNEVGLFEVAYVCIYNVFFLLLFLWFLLFRHS